MTPEERLNKLEGDLARMREDHDTSFAGIRRLAIRYRRMRDADHKGIMAWHRAFQASLEAERAARRAQHEAFMVEHEKRMAEIRAYRERQKDTEGRVDGVEEMTKFLRELLEKNLRPPEKPPEAKN